ncbi:MAG TPA: 4-hydroxy-3-methylbut-2-enyl diphosphate reductase [Terriglobia bacterium]|nr:4-hydroxy-3-methylbut-2-enyl diphosphate reductase [Terriglobia bacterium]
MGGSKTQTYYQKGLGLRAEIRPQLRETYRSQIVDVMRANGFRLDVGELTFLLAMEFGFCYGVERAVEYAYETVAKFAGRRIFLTGEIIHNPHVNGKLQSMGIRFLPEGEGKYDAVQAEDVVIIPAFGIPAADIALLEHKQCVVVDTTCGSVLNVWKNVERYARIGVTSVIHGKVEHEETKATFSRTTLQSGAHYLVIRDKNEAGVVCRYIAEGGDRGAFMNTFGKSVSEGFDPDANLARIGLANQTTMLSSESLEIAEMLRVALLARYGQKELPERFHSFDTICSATQDRQDAVRGLEDRNIDLMIVIGGYNSSNTNNLAKIASEFAPTFHIEDAEAILSPEQIRHKPAGSKKEITTENWFPPSSRTIGITAGASTPNNQIGEAVERISGFRGTIDVASILGAH